MFVPLRSLFFFLPIVFAVPHIPQVVFPSKENPNRNDGISRGKSQTRGTGSTNVPANNRSQQQNSSVSGPVQNELPIQHEEIWYRQDVDERGRETRVVFAPIEGEKVYTLDKYVIVGNERAQTVQPVLPAAQKPPRTALAAAKTRGLSAVSEMIIADQRRTTMSEQMGAFTATTPRMIMNSVYIRPLVNLQPKNGNDPNRQRNIRLVSHDTASGSDVRYPAQEWQLPPALASARAAATREATVNRIEEEGTVDRETNFEEAVKQYDKERQNHSPVNPTAASIRAMVKQIDDAIQQTLGGLGAAASARGATIEPKRLLQMTYVNGDKNRIRATFATRHGNRAEATAIPLPPASAFGDESDTDLLMGSVTAPPPVDAQEMAARPAVILPPQQTLPPVMTVHPVTQTPHSALLEHHHHHPIIPQQQPIPIPSASTPAPYTPLDPNYKLDLCCRKQQVSSVCQAFCNFDTFTDRSLVTAVLSNQCPGPQLGQAFDCASSKADHTDCCVRNNLHLYAGGQCMPFCRTHQPTPPNLISYITCLQVFDSIKNCYREYSYSHPNIFGD